MELESNILVVVHNREDNKVQVLNFSNPHHIDKLSDEEVAERDVDTLMKSLELVIDHVPLTNEQRVKASKIISKIFK